MPTDTITVGGQAMNKKAVYFGGAAALGIIAYAWYKNSQEGPAILSADPNLAAVPVPSDIPGFSVYGPDAGRIPQSNNEWYDLAISKAEQIGLDGEAVGLALGKFLGRRPLTTAEEDLVRWALGAVGNPPQGEYNVIEIPSGGVSNLPGPIMSIAAQRLNSETMRISWSNSERATSYEIKGWPTNGNDPGYWVPSAANFHDARLGASAEAPWTGGEYIYVTRGINEAGAGPEKTITFLA